ncbi:MAG: PEGA domain-containing protein [Paucimonas sp.]|jgi:hypothetical protein|nr:PEGA domain-containing protein [Paucimonas sp.]
MNHTFKQFAVLAMLATPFAHADSLLRVTCADDDSDAVVTIDNNAVGSCPVITAMPAGTYQVRVVKTVGADQEQVFEKEVVLVEGRPQSIDAELSAPRLTAEAVSANARAEAAKTLERAQNGDVDAMLALAALYEQGSGVDKAPAKAAYWRTMATQAKAKAAQDQFLTLMQGAKNGNEASMYAVANAYDSGDGVPQDHGKAAAWRQMAKQKSLDQRLEANGFFNDLKHYNFSDPGMFTSSTTFVPISLMIGVIESPSVTSRQMSIRSEAAMRPASYGNPDSMIARAAQRQETVLAAK